MKVPLIDLAAHYRALQAETDAAIRGVLESGHYVLGPNVAALEKEIAADLGVSHAVGVASGTDALVLALRALNIGPGDEVIVPAYTFFATASAVLLVGARPVFVDVRPDTLCMDVEKFANGITSKTKAVIPVHLFGCPADMSPLLQVARDHRLKVIEDNAQAYGARYRDKKTGSMGDVSCLSFFPSKNLAGVGDGGMVVTNDSEIAGRIRMLRTHGWRKKYYPEMLGYNSRLDELQAAILRVQLKHLEDGNRRRREIADQYAARLPSLGVKTPVEPANTLHVYHLYIVRTAQREKLQLHLNEKGISTGIYYPQLPCAAEPCRSLGYRAGDFPVAEQACAETLAIPLFPMMTNEQIDAVVGAFPKQGALS